ncbi:MAG: hypothetical protein ACO3RV_09635, partial [Luteolibacter sp.]
KMPVTHDPAIIATLTTGPRLRRLRLNLDSFNTGVKLKVLPTGMVAPSGYRYHAFEIDQGDAPQAFLRLAVEALE